MNPFAAHVHKKILAPDADGEGHSFLGFRNSGSENLENFRRGDVVSAAVVGDVCVRAVGRGRIARLVIIVSIIFPITDLDNRILMCAILPVKESFSKTGSVFSQIRGEGDDAGKAIWYIADDPMLQPVT